MAQQEAVIDFYRYPSIGQEDWRYAYATARVRVLQTQMLSRGTFLDMANADSFTTALELLGGSEYAMSQAVTSLTQIEKMLLERRSSVRDLFVYLMLDEGIVELLRAREDFANMRLAVRRVVTEIPALWPNGASSSAQWGQSGAILRMERWTGTNPDALGCALCMEG